jgi:hypothetical protein
MGFIPMVYGLFLDICFFVLVPGLLDPGIQVLLFFLIVYEFIFLITS